MITIEQYNRERDEMLKKRDPVEVIRFARKYSNKPLPSLDVAEISMHQMTTAIRSMPMALRQESKRWLLDHGYRSHDDGDVKVCKKAQT